MQELEGQRGEGLVFRKLMLSLKFLDYQDRQGDPIWSAQPCLHTIWKENAYQVDHLPSQKPQVKFKCYHEDHMGISNTCCMIINFVHSHIAIMIMCNPILKVL